MIKKERCCIRPEMQHHSRQHRASPGSPLDVLIDIGAQLLTCLLGRAATGQSALPGLVAEETKSFIPANVAVLAVIDRAAIGLTLIAARAADRRQQAHQDRATDSQASYSLHDRLTFSVPSSRVGHRPRTSYWRAPFTRLPDIRARGVVLTRGDRIAAVLVLTFAAAAKSPLFSASGFRGWAGLMSEALNRPGTARGLRTHRWRQNAHETR